MNNPPSNGFRHRPSWSLPGLGLLKGLVVTAQNMIQSYYRKERMTTVQYPEQRAPISPNFRNFPFLVYDGNDPAVGPALHRLLDLREGMPAAVHLHRAGTRRQRQIAQAPEGVSISTSRSA